MSDPLKFLEAAVEEGKKVSVDVLSTLHDMCVIEGSMKMEDKNKWIVYFQRHLEKYEQEYLKSGNRGSAESVKRDGLS